MKAHKDKSTEIEKQTHSFAIMIKITMFSLVRGSGSGIVAFYDFFEQTSIHAPALHTYILYNDDEIITVPFVFVQTTNQAGWWFSNMMIKKIKIFFLRGEDNDNDKKRMHCVYYYVS